MTDAERMGELRVAMNISIPVSLRLWCEARRVELGYLSLSEYVRSLILADRQKQKEADGGHDQAGEQGIPGGL